MELLGHIMGDSGFFFSQHIQVIHPLSRLYSNYSTERRALSLYIRMSMSWRGSSLIASIVWSSVTASAALVRFVTVRVSRCLRAVCDTLRAVSNTFNRRCSRFIISFGRVPLLPLLRFNSNGGVRSRFFLIARHGFPTLIVFT